MQRVLKKILTFRIISKPDTIISKCLKIYFTIYTKKSAIIVIFALKINLKFIFFITNNKEG